MLFFRQSLDRREEATTSMREAAHVDELVVRRNDAVTLKAITLEKAASSLQ